MKRFLKLTAIAATSCNVAVGANERYDNKSSSVEAVLDSVGDKEYIFFNLFLVLFDVPLVLPTLAVVAVVAALVTLVTLVALAAASSAAVVSSSPPMLTSSLAIKKGRASSIVLHPPSKNRQLQTSLPSKYPASSQLTNVLPS